MYENFVRNHFYPGFLVRYALQVIGWSVPLNGVGLKMLFLILMLLLQSVLLGGLLLRYYH